MFVCKVDKLGETVVLGEREVLLENDGDLEIVEEVHAEREAMGQLDTVLLTQSEGCGDTEYFIEREALEQGEGLVECESVVDPDGDPEREKVVDEEALALGHVEDVGVRQDVGV